MSDSGAPGRSGNVVVVVLAALAVSVGVFIAYWTAVLAYLLGTPVWAIGVAVVGALAGLTVAADRVRRSAERQ